MTLLVHTLRLTQLRITAHFIKQSLKYWYCIGPMAPKEESRSTTSSNSKRSVVVVVRHGERLDYVMRDAGQNWIPTAERPWDPPLTERGHQQANALGAALPNILNELGLPSIAAIYCSPFWRCCQTAAGLAKNQRENSTASALKVKVEMGLAESMNENWYRSWAVPGTDGSWGYQKQEKPLADLDASTLHPAAAEPVQKVLDWKLGANDETIIAQMDSEYVSKTVLDTPFSMHPPNFESFKMQRSRMQDSLEMLSADHSNETIVLVSHGGPVTHLYESLTGNKWDVHGESKYCCYSIYQQTDGEDTWTPLVVNQVLGTEQGTSSAPAAATADGKTFTWA